MLVNSVPLQGNSDSIRCLPMRRIAFYLLSCISLMLCVAIAVMWVRSCSTADIWLVHYGNQSNQLRVASGVFTFQAWKKYSLETDFQRYVYKHVADRNLGNGDFRGSYPGYAWTWHQFSLLRVYDGLPPTPQMIKHQQDTLGSVARQFSLIRPNSNQDQKKRLQLEMQLEQLMMLKGGWMFALRVPAWLLMIVTLLLPALGCYSFARRRNQRDARLCRKCGYDLRATPDRCPECGLPQTANG